ncbi:hypothetical protein CW304_16280 [Bacillus sp. UFRGS-B20]|nr:hypothetical protein CW304_16280 [Bacillus sp. UFRGS-B20]
MEDYASTPIFRLESAEVNSGSNNISYWESLDPIGKLKEDTYIKKRKRSRKKRRSLEQCEKTSTCVFVFVEKDIIKSLSIRGTYL